MNTGTCKRTLLGLTTLIVLSACSELPSLGALKEIAPFPAKTGIPITQAQMVQGNVTLVPPSGFCIDPSSLTQQFALMARCDTLGATNGALDAPLGLLTVSIEKSKGTALSATSLAQENGSQVIETLEFENVDIVSATSEMPQSGLSSNHLRGAAQINGYDLSLALFSPAQSAAQGPRGPQMIQNLLRSSQDASVAKALAAQNTQGETQKKSGLDSVVSNLFD